MTESSSSASQKNPYESPALPDDNPFGNAGSESTAGANAAKDSAENRKFNRLGRLFVAWERLRVIYNIALAVVTVPIAILMVVGADDRLLVAGNLAEVCIVGFFGANLCFTAGHYINAWLMIFGLKGRTITILLFWSGVGISIPLAILAITEATASGLFGMW